MEQQESGTSRRAFLERLGAVGGTAMVMAAMDAWHVPTASAATAPPALTGAGKGKTIVILGAGHAGQVAAFELNKLGYRCIVLEARGFAGGRVQTARRGFTATELGGETQRCDFDPGEYLNIGPWRIPFHHRSTLHYTKQFGVPLETMVNDNDAAWMQHNDGSGALKGKRVRQYEVKTDLRGRVNELIAKAATSGQLDQQVRAEDRELFLDYLASSGRLKKDLAYRGSDLRGYVKPPGAGDQPGTIDDPYGLSDLLQSHLWRDFQVGEYTHPLTMFQPVGGMDQIAKAFEKRNAPMLRFNCEVQQIRQTDKAVTVNYVDTKTGKTASVTGDFCLCTIPLSVLRSIDTPFSDDFRAAMDDATYVPVGKIGLQMKRRFWEEDDGIYGGHVKLDHPAIRQISLPSNNFQGQKGTLLGAYLLFDGATEVSAMSLKERIDYALAAGEAVFPGSYRANFERGFSWFWHLAKYNLGGWANWTAEARKDSYPKLLNADGRIYLAGEHLSYLGGWQAGAIESAWQQIEKIHQRAQQA
ncbi:flavin monoamine oxidase family protein [Roseiterribacter gracilis]|uniref:Tryptophan 2-monooxygenase n=1 Tax=Roseiterribacter gracilis TaxID=2812848 RepID=A0A8S8XGA5_9PROT|nr:monoamine oxidase [Rhodospirillales bacterium TMPK1]